MYSPTIHCPIGYCLTDPQGGFAFPAPRTVFSTRDRPLGMRAIQNCPAVNNIERQLVELPSPYGLRLRMARGPQGGYGIQIVEQGTFVQPDKLSDILAVEPPARWRHPKKPVIQLRLPYFFVTDEPCMLAQMPPFLGPAMRRWPGTMVAGRWPLALWPQNLTWALEWDDPTQELAIKQGEPLCLFFFEFNNPDKRPEMVEAQLTPELEEYRLGMQGLHHITDKIEEVWEMARARRPARLLVPIDEAGDA
ncbi:MAG: hypothetical protein RQ752_05055 [Thermohalobaculum sp.]|nr:hypothetical protein [Thermohalobaculum sp.]